ncbi:hypothetical protein GGS20DRAFT_26449 [Poronia punctata]|nr:hypothetical protein GGS20DRAFT_26449 [Poronia punctata]
MDPPAAKKRRLAPKGEAQLSPSSYPPQPPVTAMAASYGQESTANHTQTPATYPPPDIPAEERPEFEYFARHLQDAAMLIVDQSQRLPYKKVSVLLLRWEEDAATEADLVALEQVLRDRYGYSIKRWNIPTTPNPGIKLGVWMSSFLQSASPEHLFIIHYAGYSFNGADKQLYWASNSKKDAPRLRWSGFRCLIEETPSDVLLLLDCGVIREPTEKGGSSTKQIIAAGPCDHYVREPGARSFSANLTEAFLQLDHGRLFTTEQLYMEAARLRQQELLQSPKLSNGAANENLSVLDKRPLLYSLTSGKREIISLRPLRLLATPQIASLGTVGDAASWTSPDYDAMQPGTAPDIMFDEPRVLVCTTFVGEASPDLSSFHHWLQHPPALGSNIVVEGMFLGPPTMMLISMTSAVWNIVQHDKVCCYLGHINSHNLTPLYKRLVGPMSTKKTLTKNTEDGRVLLEARGGPAPTTTATTITTTTTSTPPTPAVRRHMLPETPVRRESLDRAELMKLSQSRVGSGRPYSGTRPGTAASRKEYVEETAEMQEAAEQLKALSHVRHVSDDMSTARVHSSPSVRPGQLKLERSMDETKPSTSSRPKQGRRSIVKPTAKQETRCTHCSATPFKDSSSLRKHIAAAHTRPFPCAFSFAGCSSTFGSKNEWKRHIASQHLCLQFYRCSDCPHLTEGKGNEFNRKDLFTQHLRRMHAPFQIKKAAAKGDGKIQLEWDTRVKEMQQTCLVTRRKPPQRSACPKPDCASIFEGPTSWDEWTEHVGRHMEKGEADRLGVDDLLAQWAFDEGIIERNEDGKYRLCSGNGSNTEKESHQHTDYHSDSQKRDAEERTIIAASTIVDKMDVD